MRTRTKLDTLQRIKEEMASIYRMAKSKQIDIKEATKLAYLLELLFRMQRDANLEKQIEELESKLAEFQS